MSEDSNHNKEYDASVSEDDEEIEEESNQSPSENKKKRSCLRKNLYIDCKSYTTKRVKYPGDEIVDCAIREYKKPETGSKKDKIYKKVSQEFVLHKNLTADKLVRFVQARLKKLDQANKSNPINNNRDLAANPRTEVEVAKNIIENININTSFEEPEVVKKVTSNSEEDYKKIMEVNKDLNAESKYMFK